MIYDGETIVEEIPRSTPGIFFTDDDPREAAKEFALLVSDVAALKESNGVSAFDPDSTLYASSSSDSFHPTGDTKAARYVRRAQALGAIFAAAVSDVAPVRVKGWMYARLRRPEGRKPRTNKEAADALGVSESSIERWTREVDRAIDRELAKRDYEL
jgi:hypothetical protein